MSEIIVLLLALGAYREAMGEDAHAEEGDRLYIRYRKTIDAGFAKYIEPLIEGYPQFKRFRSVLAQASVGSPEHQAQKKYELLREILPILRPRRDVVEAAFSERRAVDVVFKAAMAAVEDDPKMILQKVAVIPTAAKIQVARNWIKAAARLAGAEPEMAESVLADADTSREIGEELRQVNAAITQVDPLSEKGAALQVRRQEVIDRIDEVASTSDSPETVFTTAATQAAAEPRVYQTQTGSKQRLNPDKEDAMMIRGKGIIAAGAGAGKTLTLASKVVYHINELGVPPASVIATSFSKDSAAELRQRIERYGATFGDREDRGLGTTHSVARKVMSDYGAGFQGDLLKDYDQTKLIKLAMKQVEMGNGSIPVPEATSLFAGVAPAEEAPPAGLTFRQALRIVYDNRDRLPVWRGARNPYFLRDFISDGFFNPQTRYYEINDEKSQGFTDPRGLTDNVKKNLKRCFDALRVDYHPNTDPNLMGRGRTAAKKDKNVGLKKYTSFKRPVGEWFNLGIDLVRETSKGKVPIPPGEFSAEITKLKGKLISPTEAWHMDVVEPMYAAVYGAYEYLKGAKGVDEDFRGRPDQDDTFIMAIRQMLARPNRLKQAQANFKVILVDEAQDLNRSQHVFFGLLAGFIDPAKVTSAASAQKVAELARDDGEMTADTYCFIGDDKQAIYEFRGADPEAFIDMSDLIDGGAGFKTHVLETNYRSGKEIVQAANRLIAHNKKQIPMVCNANPDRMDEGGVHIIPFPPIEARDYSAPAEWVAEQIEEQMELGLAQHGDSFKGYNSFGIGLRTRAEGYAYGLELIKRGIPFRSTIDFFSNHTAKMLIAWMTIANHENESDENINEAVLAARGAPKTFLGNAFVTRLTEMASGNYLDWLNDNYTSLYPRSRRHNENVERYLENLNYVAGLTGSNEEILNAVLDLEGVGNTTIKDALVEQVQNNNERMAALIAESDDGVVSEEALMEEAMAPISALMGLLESRADLTEAMIYVRKLKSAAKDLKKKNTKDREPAVQFGTMHSWKGLEVPTMFVPMVGGGFPRYDKVADEDEMASERRLAYVAITRGEDQVFVLDIPTQRTTKQGIVIQTSQFVSELCAPPEPVADPPSEGRMAAFSRASYIPMSKQELQDIEDQMEAELAAFDAEIEGLEATSPSSMALMASWGDLLYTKKG
jgi:superfamily I DNA/RNA helicase